MSHRLRRHGARPVLGADERHAEPTLAAFISDLGLDSITVTPTPSADGEGRFGFTLVLGSRAVTVGVPGLPAERVRYVRGAGDVWDFPRLLVGADWFLWPYALARVRAALQADA